MGIAWDALDRGSKAQDMGGFGRKMMLPTSRDIEATTPSRLHFKVDARQLNKRHVLLSLSMI